ncbi:3-oxoacyl-[acyl-carrier-protein] reductase FabG-like protein [Leptotrombidium deliense]|uniref:3-oxoacyl-[acyl-carrier-protein] reductase FabG-like protein n=1 Tax=Leptotrombidium deliense TaxID=299467 RepID=A0A443S295_9ACAR|nr:3-oxoacyl-[acyl-carrier-protein] reductase FabG-like protein [Leptotrombidium deliense]
MPKLLEDLKDKVVVVTGSSNGIGEAIVTLFASLGSKVVVNGRDETNVEKVANKCQSMSPNNYKALQFVGDITNKDVAKQLIEKTIDTFGKLDVLVNNAAIHKDVRILDKDVLQDFDDHHSINIRSAVHLCHLSLPHLIESKGCIVNISAIPKPVRISFVKLCNTTNSILILQYFLNPCLTKASLDMLTKVLALEFGPKGVRVNAINVGPTDTPIFQKQPNYEAMKAMFASRIPLGRVGQPIDIAKPAVFLASEGASFITGALVPVDGGLMLA